MRRTGLSFPLKRPACCVLLIGLIASIALFSWVYAREGHDEHADFERRAKFRVAALQQGVGNAVDALRIVNRLFVTNGTVSREQFQVFTEPLLAQYPYIEAFGFHQLVSGAERPAFMDDAARRAEDSGLPSATSLFQLLKDRQAIRSIRILMPVYRSGASVADVAARRLAVVGYTGTLLRAHDLVEKILASAGSLGNAALDIRVYATASADESQLVYASGPAARPPSASQPEPYSRIVDVAGTPWRMVLAARPQPFVAAHSGALMVLLIGCLTTLAASAWSQSVSLRAQRIQLLVASRTDELKHINEVLVASEERARELAELSSDWDWEQDRHFRYTALSSGAYVKGGPPAHIMLGAIRWEMPVDVQASDWPAHQALLRAHQPFRNFEFKLCLEGMPIQWISCSGKPRFDRDGRFDGYRGTARSISDRKAADEALQHSQSALRLMAGHQESVKEDERKRIARDIHDELGQNLMALCIDMSLMAQRPDVHAGTRSMALASLTLIDTTIRSVRAIINDLRPGVLDLGLHAALEWQARQFKLRSGIACDLQIDHGEFALDDKRATAMFRIVQESLSNVLRHAQASRVQIGMQRRQGVLFLRIADDGIGLCADYRKKANTFGLTGIEERLHAMGGTFSMANNPGRGMALDISIPI